MKCVLTTLDGLKRKLDIQVSKEQVQQSFDFHYKQWQKKLNIPGFRKGKVPLEYVQTHQKEEVKKDVLLSLVDKFYSDALKQQNLTPANQPKMELSAPVEENKTFQFSVTVEIQPEIVVDKAFQVQLVKTTLNVTEKEVESSIQDMRYNSATFTPIKDRAVQWNDFVEWEITQDCAEKTGLNKKQKCELIKDKSEERIIGLMEGLIGMQVGEKKDIPIIFSKDYDLQEKVGKKCVLKISLLSIQQIHLPELDESFLKKFNCKGKDELKKIVHYSLMRQQEEKIMKNQREEVMTQLIASYPIECFPAQVLQRQQQALIKSTMQHLKSLKMPDQDIQKYTDKHQEDFRKDAEFVVHSSYVISALAKKLNIVSSAQEISVQCQKMGLSNNSENNNYVEGILEHEKVIEHLIKSARIKESS